MNGEPSSPAQAARTALLRAALLDGEVVHASWRQWKPTLDRDDLPSESYTLLPILYRNLERHGVQDPWLPRLKGVYRRNWYQNQSLLGRIAAPLRALEQAGIETLLLRGTALAALRLMDEGACVLPEIALAVPLDRVHQALGLLDGLGWHGSPARPLAAGSPAGSAAAGGEADLSPSHALVLSRAEHKLELSWYPCVCRRYEAASHRFWRAAKSATVRGVTTRALDASDLLFLYCVDEIGFRQGPSLGAVAAASAILRGAAAELDWDRIVDNARALQLGWAMSEALGFLVTTLEAEVPPSALRALAALPRPWRERLEQRGAQRPNPPDGLGDVILDRYLQFHQSREVEAPLRPTEFLHYLQRAWGIGRPWQVPFYGAAKTLRYLTARPRAR